MKHKLEVWFNSLNFQKFFDSCSCLFIILSSVPPFVIYYLYIFYAYSHCLIYFRFTDLRCINHVLIQFFVTSIISAVQIFIVWVISSAHIGVADEMMFVIWCVLIYYLHVLQYNPPVFYSIPCLIGSPALVVPVLTFGYFFDMGSFTSIAFMR